MKLLFSLLFFFLLTINLSFAESKEASSLIRGYVSNKAHTPLKLKVFQMEEEFFYLSEKNLDDNSISPHLNMRVVAENINDYSLNIEDEKIFVPQATKLSGFISQIEPPKKFNKKGFYRVTFDKAVCPSGEEIVLKSKITSKSQSAIYNPAHHVGKAALGLVGGSLAGALFTYQLGGLGLALATHGYSLAAGAATGGFVGTVGGVTSKGKDVSIEPGSELVLIPIDEVSLDELKQISCKPSEIKNIEISEADKAPDSVQLEMLKVKQKKDLLGETLLKIKFKITNNSSEAYRLNNFIVRDSQGKEYTASIMDVKTDIFTELLPNETTTIALDFFVDHPKASHWLVLKNKTFSEEVGSWKIIQ